MGKPDGSTQGTQDNNMDTLETQGSNVAQMMMQPISAEANIFLTVIPYSTDLWDGNFALISLFSIDHLLAGDSANMQCSLQRIVSEK